MKTLAIVLALTASFMASKCDIDFNSKAPATVEVR